MMKIFCLVLVFVGLLIGCQKNQEDLPIKSSQDKESETVHDQRLAGNTQTEEKLREMNEEKKLKLLCQSYQEYQEDLVRQSLVEYLRDLKQKGNSIGKNVELHGVIDKCFAGMEEHFEKFDQNILIVLMEWLAFLSDESSLQKKLFILFQKSFEKWPYETLMISLRNKKMHTCSWMDAMWSEHKQKKESFHEKLTVLKKEVEVKEVRDQKEESLLIQIDNCLIRLNDSK
jgi:hypothetical protein